MPRKIFIIAGHGAGDPGSGGGGYDEADLVRRLASRIKHYGGGYVKLADPSRNYYADGGINRLTLDPKKWRIIELHMDAASPSAKGGHVIVNAGTKPGTVIKAMEKFISETWPGRATTLSFRSDLANPKRAAAKGYYYMLTENGFITNKGDRDKFIQDMDDVAKGYLNACGYKLIGKEYTLNGDHYLRKSNTLASAKVRPAIYKKGSKAVFERYSGSYWAVYRMEDGKVGYLKRKWVE